MRLITWNCQSAFRKKADLIVALQRNINKPYHIDYCFASADLLNKVKNIEIGTYENWSAFSDHAPLTIDLDL